MPTVNDLCAAMELIAPAAGASHWDNTGLLLGRPTARVERVLVCLDLTPCVLSEAQADVVDAVVSYHPILFKGTRQLTSTAPGGDVVLGAAESGIAVYSPHTALDAAPGGMADWLAEGLGEGLTWPIEPQRDLPETESRMVITYSPRSATDAIRKAMSAAGAGRIGAYDHCSTSIESVGTFRGGEGTHPAVGQPGSLERVDETRLMMVCGEGDLPQVIAALHAAHPYERPPVHVIELRPHPSRGAGGGRMLEFNTPQTPRDVANRLKCHLGVDALRFSQSLDARETHAVAACCPGSGGSMLESARHAGATLFVTGEMRHHELREAAERGVSVLLAGHAHSERGYLPLLRDAIASKLADVDVRVSADEPSPWRPI